MVVGAHPADAVDCTGGTIAQHAGMGDEINIVTVTDGLDSHSKGTCTMEDKRDEVYESLSKLISLSVSLRLLFMGLKDEPFMARRSNVIYLVELIRQYRPDILITHHPNEYAHWDHAEVGKMVCRALKGAIKRPGDDKWWVNNVYFFATQFRPETARIGYTPQPPNVLIDISESVGKKVKAMCCFKSQGHDDEEAMWRRMNSMEKEMGRADGLEYAEGFISYYPAKEKVLPMSSINAGFYSKAKYEHIWDLGVTGMGTTGRQTFGRLKEEERDD